MVHIGDYRSYALMAVKEMTPLGILSILFFPSVQRFQAVLFYCIFQRKHRVWFLKDRKTAVGEVAVTDLYNTGNTTRCWRNNIVLAIFHILSPKNLNILALLQSVKQTHKHITVQILLKHSRPDILTL